MSKKFPLATLGEVVTSVKRSVVPVPGTTYRQIGVKLWGRGAYEREPMDGAQTKYRTLFRVEAGDIIVNKIWARNGSVAIVEESLAGCYGSSEFPIFAPIREKLDCRWLHWLTKTRSFWNQCDEKSRGTSGKNRIRPERFLEIKIPLPPLPEQRRIVEKIQELTAKIEEAKGLRREAIESAETLVDSALRKSIPFKTDLMPPGWFLTNLGDLNVVEIIMGQSPPGHTYNKSGEGLSFYQGKADFGKIYPDTRNWCTSPIRIAYRGDVLMSIRAPVGPINLSKEKCCIGRGLTAIRPRGRIISKYLYYCLKIQLKEIERMGQGSTFKAIGRKKIEQIPIWVAPLEEQYHIVAYLDNLQEKIYGIKHLQIETQSELDALIPSVLAKEFRREL